MNMVLMGTFFIINHLVRWLILFDNILFRY